MLEGSVRRTDSRLRITTQLIGVSDGYHLWTEQYDRELKDIFAIQEEIAQSIAQALKVKLSDSEKRAIEKTSTRSIEAYDFYLRGRQFFYRHKRKYMQHAIDLFSPQAKALPGSRIICRPCFFRKFLRILIR